ncbi:MAG: DUF3071 domain-containing protein [Propionibacteriaceae bacterium]|jgi:hypothetical protein|nr:DUF3071 domain-containing protein [Propionibacteriaceae bacterium]
MDSALSPREIQSRIRAGATTAEVAEVAGVPAEQLQPFAMPVLAERDYIAQTAAARPVHRGGEVIPHRTLADIVAEKLSGKGLDAPVWDAWKVGERKWLVQISYDGHVARFLYDQAGQFSQAENKDASWLVGLRAPDAAPVGKSEPERTVKLNDDLALVRAVELAELPDFEVEPFDFPSLDADVEAAAAADGEAPAPHVEIDEDTSIDAFTSSQLTEVDGVYDVVSTDTGGIDVLYEMLSGLDEDSVQIYRGLLQEAGAAPPPPAEPETPAEVVASGHGHEHVGPEPEEPPAEQPSLIDGAPDAKPKKKRARAKVPSWDEIIFGRK